MGYKSVRQLYFIEDEMDAVDVYNRLRSHLLIIEYPTAGEGRKEHEQAHLNPLALVCEGRHAVFPVPLQQDT